MNSVQFILAIVSLSLFEVFVSCKPIPDPGCWSQPCDQGIHTSYPQQYGNLQYVGVPNNMPMVIPQQNNMPMVVPQQNQFPMPVVQPVHMPQPVIQPMQIPQPVIQPMQMPQPVFQAVQMPQPIPVPQPVGQSVYFPQPHLPVKSTVIQIVPPGIQQPPQFVVPQYQGNIGAIPTKCG